MIFKLKWSWIFIIFHEQIIILKNSRLNLELKICMMPKNSQCGKLTKKFWKHK